MLSKAKGDFLVDWHHELYTCTCNQSIFKPFIDLRITRPTQQVMLSKTQERFKDKPTKLKVFKLYGSWFTQGQSKKRALNLGKKWVMNICKKKTFAWPMKWYGMHRRSPCLFPFRRGKGFSIFFGYWC